MTGIFEHDLLGTLSTTPNLDLNGDRFHDLLVGAAGGDVLSGGIKPQAGKVYAIYGSPKIDPNQPSPAERDSARVLSNRTLTGAGDFLPRLQRTTGC